MPIYEYQCSACKHELEAMQKISDKPLTVCPACNQPSLTRLISPAGFQLKGTGWYATDFRNKGKVKDKQETKGESTPSENKGKDDKGSSSSGAQTTGSKTE